jgi:hypothetical protein
MMFSFASRVLCGLNTRCLHGACKAGGRKRGNVLLLHAHPVRALSETVLLLAAATAAAVGSSLQRRPGTPRTILMVFTLSIGGNWQHFSFRGLSPRSVALSE